MIGLRRADRLTPTSMTTRWTFPFRNHTHQSHQLLPIDLGNSGWASWDGSPPTWPAPHHFTPTTDKGQPQPLATLSLVTHPACPRWVQQAALPGLYPRSILLHSALSCKLHRIRDPSASGAIICSTQRPLSSGASRVPQCGWELHTAPPSPMGPPGYTSVAGSTQENFQTANVTGSKSGPQDPRGSFASVAAMATSSTFSTSSTSSCTLVASSLTHSLSNGFPSTCCGLHLP